MKRWMWALLVLCAAASFPAGGCEDDTQPVRDDARPDDRGGADADADADAEVAADGDGDADAEAATDGDADADDAADADADDECGPTTCPNDPIGGPIGVECTDDPDCEPGFRCMRESVDVWHDREYVTFQGGYCITYGAGSAGCDPDVPETCPEGSICILLFIDEATGQEYYGCVDECSYASSSGVPWTNNCDCRDGYECLLGSGFCWTGCSNDNECCEIYHDGEGGRDDGARQDAEVTELPATECTDTCDPCTYSCIKNGCPGGDCAVGDGCLHDSDCPPMGRCLEEYYYDWAIGGLCIQDSCDLTGRECPEGAGCANLGSSLDPFYTCVVPCAAGTQPGDTDYPCRDVDPAGPSEGDYACNPVSEGFYWDPISDDGFCWPGNFTEGTAAVGTECEEDSECLSPFGLGSCMTLWETPPSFCTISCGETMAVDGVCQPESETTGTASAACAIGICLPSCDTPSGTLGDNGCALRMACYDTSVFGDIWVKDGTDAPTGLCFAPCVDDDWCSNMFSGGPTCNTATGICEP
jgi:hypothetical protein